MNLIRELHALQEARGHLADDDLAGLAARLRVPLYEIQGVVSFYPHFRRAAAPPVRIGACRDVACHLRDGGAALRRIEALAAGRDDVGFEPISCPGLCDRAPACLWNDVPAAASAVEAALAPGARGSAPPPEPAPPPARRFASDPYAAAGERYGELVKLAAAADPDAAAGHAVTRLEASGLRGMGGAGFEAGRKWRLVRERPPGPRVVICNADESEPGAFKDREILERLPHLVIEGAALAGLVVGAERGIVYLRHEYRRAASVLREAIASARTGGFLGPDVCGSGRRFELELFVSPGGYILGEETALLEALEGRRGEPRNKPPFPGVAGLHGWPTLINNVETLAHVPRTLRTGRAELKLFAVSGDVAEPGVVEAPLGTPFRELLARVGGVRDGRALLAFQPGGASTAFLPASQIDVPMDWEPLRAAGSALGAGAVVVLGEGADLNAVGRNLTAFFRNESCGKCVPCRIGTQKAVELIDRGDAASLALLPELDAALRETSLCGLGQVALTPVRSLLEGVQAPSSAGDDE